MNILEEEDLQEKLKNKDILEDFYSLIEDSKKESKNLLQEIKIENQKLLDIKILKKKNILKRYSFYFHFKLSTLFSFTCLIIIIICSIIILLMK